MRRGYAILLDSIVALTFALVIMTALIGMRYTGSSTADMSFKKMHYVSEDALDVLNKYGVLDQVGEDWAAAAGNTSSPSFLNASNISRYYLDQILPPNVGYMLTIDDEPIANNTRIPLEKSSSLTHSTRLLVGYGRGLPTRGFVSRSFLSNIKEKETSSYTYFGGFVGQGNLTVYVRDIPPDANIKRCCLELNSPSNFDLYINGNLAGSLDPVGGNMSANLGEGIVGDPGDPGVGCIDDSQLSSIVPGVDNEFEILFTEGNITKNYVGGGFIHVLYNTSEMDTDEISKTSRYYFPGINGLINLYDSFYVPGVIESMSANLHFLCNYSLYLNLGHITVFNATGNDTDQNVTIPAAEMASKGLIYQPVGDPHSLSMNTVPIRFGTGNLTQIIESGNADVVLITDVSGSMQWRMENNSVIGTVRDCNNPSLFDSTTRRISLAKCLAASFINTVMNYSGNRIALVTFDTESEADGGDPYHFTDAQDNDSLISHVMGYSDWPSGGTCVCCAINRAYQLLNDEGSPGRNRFIIVMTDGITGYNCGGCDYDTDDFIFSTSFEDDAELSQWGFDPVRTTAIQNLNFGRASAGPYGPHSGGSYMGIWGNHGGVGKYVAINRTTIDLSAYTNISVKVWYSYESTESADKIGFYYWNNSAWVRIFEVLSPAIGDGNQRVWTKAEAQIPDYVKNLTLQFWGRTSGDNEHIMIDDLRVTAKAANASPCGNCIQICTGTVGSFSCGGNPQDCSNTACDPAVNDAICAAKRAYEDLEAEVRSIGFGPATTNCYNAERTLQGAADCGNGVFCSGGTGAAAAECYLNFSKDIYSSSSKSQTVYFGGELQPSTLYPDSYLEFSYIPANESLYGEVSLKRSTDRFDDTVDCEGVIGIPAGVVVSEAKVTSYSGEHWTDYLDISNTGGPAVIYDLSDWTSDMYMLMGDPYIVDIPAQEVVAGMNNTVTILTGDNSTNTTGCSADDRAIYTIRMMSLVGYGGVFLNNDGCEWDIEFEDGTTFTAPIPSSYTGTGECFYTAANISYIGNDAMNDAVYRLLNQLDLDDDGRVDLLFDPDMIKFEVSRAGGVQSLWGPAKFKLIVWM